MKKIIFILYVILLAGCGQISIPKAVADLSTTLPDEIDYNLHVKKILSDKCFSCHGPDAKKQKAELRLDIASFAYNKETASGLKAIAPKSISNSELVHRILSDDPEYKMPSPSSHLELTAYEKAILIKWIEQGAIYKPHWAFVAPLKTHTPKVENKEWANNAIDLFILPLLTINRTWSNRNTTHLQAPQYYCHSRLKCLLCKPLPAPIHMPVSTNSNLKMYYFFL